MTKYDIGFSQVAEQARLEAYQQGIKNAGEDSFLTKLILSILLILAFASPWIALWVAIKSGVSNGTV